MASYSGYRSREASGSAIAFRVDNLIDGRQISERLNQRTKKEVSKLLDRGIRPRLAFVRVGNDPASKVYVGKKERVAARVGIESQTEVLPEETTKSQLQERLDELNRNPAIHGILVQLPLPPHIRASVVYRSITPDKDVDGFHPGNMGKLLLGDLTGFVPCTPLGILELLVSSNTPTEGAHAVILGRGNLVGKPLAALLARNQVEANATVTLCHSRTRDIESYCRSADILIAAMGVPQFVKADMVKPGAVVIDVGVNRQPDPQAKSGYRLVGDVHFEEVQKIAGRITPNPGGVGPMTVAMLMYNTRIAADRITADKNV